jgi:hypothetical protein
VGCCTGRGGEVVAGRTSASRVAHAAEAPDVTGCRGISYSGHFPRQPGVVRVPPPPIGMGATATAFGARYRAPVVESCRAGPGGACWWYSMSVCRGERAHRSPIYGPLRREFLKNLAQPSARPSAPAVADAPVVVDAARAGWRRGRAPYPPLSGAHLQH